MENNYPYLLNREQASKFIGIRDDTFSVFFTVKSAKSLEPETLRYSIGYQVMAK